jgi:hypothetical protein
MLCDEVNFLMCQLELAKLEAEQALNANGGLYEEEQLILAEEELAKFWDMYRACYWQIEESHHYVQDLFDLGCDRYTSVLYCEYCKCMK